ncbi:golgin subfamily A member 7B [Pongo abelii]|uniref:golgin subfamily A member 7B n=1 Tax=Pongo abelii TaxID=9601 RepID=UPI0023E7ED07|nr:golgin subfamily A member 7B [Pongo abelii]
MAKSGLAPQSPDSQASALSALPAASLVLPVCQCHLPHLHGPTIVTPSPTYDCAHSREANHSLALSLLQIERQLFEETVKTLNGFYAEAEKIGGSSYLEGCLACATAYFIFLCMETHYEKVLKKISRYIQEQNEKIFAPRGLLLTDPVERGMRVVSFWACVRAQDC